VSPLGWSRVQGAEVAYKWRRSGRSYVLVTMEISIHSLLEGATRATGTVAIIDVFRAFTTAAVAVANGASRIVMVRSVEEALALRDAGIGQICFAPKGETGHSVAKHGRGSRSGTRRLRLQQLALRNLGRRFPRQDDYPADERRDARYCRSQSGHTALRGLAGHGRGDRPSDPLGITRSGLPRRDGRQWHQTDRRGRTVRNPPAEPPGRPTGRCERHSSPDPGRWRSRAFS
jgi:hypothetical protein